MAEPTSKSSSGGATSGSTTFVSISDSDDHTIPKAVYVNVADDYDFKGEDDVWVSHTTVVGQQLGARPKAVRHTSGATAPDAGDLVFWY